MKELFSINRAAGLLERDRATLTRALRSIKPDGFDRGQPRWFLPTIVNALAVPPQQRRDSGKARDRFSLRNKELDELQVTIERQIELIASEPSPDRRRAMAIELAPQLAEHHALFLSVGRELGIASDDVLGTRSDLVWSEWLDELSEAAQWPHNDGFSLAMIEAAWPDVDGDGEAR